MGLVSLGGTGRDDISMQFASRDFRPCWIYTWVAVKLPLASPYTGLTPMKYKGIWTIFYRKKSHICHISS